MPYKPFTNESFTRKFCGNPHFKHEGTFLAIESGNIIGFANGIINAEAANNTGYVTFVLVAKEKRRAGIGTELLRRVEDYLIKNGKTRFDIIFFNPVNLEWIIPGTDGHDHPNAPGVEKPSAGYDFCVKNGYSAVADQFSYYLPLDKFNMSGKAVQIIDKLKEKNIDFDFYGKNKHHGIQEMLENLGNPLWIKEISESIAERPQDLVIIASDNGKACGFTGPLYVQGSGRGYFTGIGVRSDYGGMGIGTVLFNMLCDEHKKGGAKFMSLFTGETNPARKMYEGAGFKHVKTWTDFRKEI
jgi:ribosomal protein S18 acetylase RimI-like enzyme